MTLEEYEALPDPKGDHYYELHFGKSVKVGKAKHGQFELQRCIRDLILKQVDAKKCVVEIEVAYHLTEGYDARAADLAVVARKRYYAIPLDSWLTGSPELVVFIKSRSNTIAATERAAVECLTHGANAAWSVSMQSEYCFGLHCRGQTRILAGQIYTSSSPYVRRHQRERYLQEAVQTEISRAHRAVVLV